MNNYIKYKYTENIYSIIRNKSLSQYYSHCDSMNNKSNQSFNLSGWNINQLVVHFEHGIGQYKGLTTIKTGKIITEYLTINYADNSKLYVPMSYFYLISKYKGLSKNNIPLHKLGSNTWNKEKEKAIKKSYDYAAMLLDIYSHRSARTGFSFQQNDKKYKKFCNSFPFILTIDQTNVINSVLKDMYKSVPMDRLVCGDVGFGKTEVAMRAAFLAVCNSKQVAVLVPTTILAQQHFNNFKIRFKNWAIKIAILSRMQTKKEVTETIKDIYNGKINILIGTHKIFLKNLQWNNLGLLIIDEEHRFGVNHKEKIKSIHNNIDILTLTATPIPRTLNMAITGMRDLSIIATPPHTRLIVKTHILEYNQKTIKKAILKEITRGGQVYYIFNNVNKIEQKTQQLKLLIPEAKIKIGHGQLKSIDLESIMNDFYHNRFNVLVCTTIIETGIDIPNANTIIIENANHFGLAQLHQLRGRVGRSQKQAYAWLLVSSFKHMTRNAGKRIEVISSIKDFNSGFKLANYDLEIRGIGEILGCNQSGHIANVGLSLYTKLLKKAIKNIKKGEKFSLKFLENHQPIIDLNVSNLLPENYIQDENVRLSIYKKIASAKTIVDLNNIKLSTIKYFGKLPDLSQNLFEIAKIRILSKTIGIKEIKLNNEGGYINFLKNNTININILINNCKKEFNCWKFKNSTTLKFKKQFVNTKLKIEWILKKLIKIGEIKF